MNKNQHRFQSQQPAEQGTSPRVIYTPPASEQIERFGQQVCRDLGEDFAQPEIIQGFVEFMKVAVAILLRHLNGGCIRV